MADTTKEHSAADSHDIPLTPFNLVRYAGSLGLLGFSIAIVGALMFTGNTRVAQDANPWVALIVCILAIVWLSMIEGQQASLVGLPPVDPDLYKDSHPLTYKNAALAFKGDNLDRYLMGRQFMVLLVVFVINQCSSPLDPSVDVLGLPDGVKFVFLDVGLASIIFTCILGQLTTQVNASHQMIDYINNYFALFTLYVAMTVEFSGVMHSSYLIQNILSAVSGKPIQTNEPPRTGFTFAFFWGRVLMSLAILGFCLAVTLVALMNGDTAVAVKYPSIKPGLAIFLLFFFMSVVGMLEGMQIAFFAVAKIPASERGNSVFGKKTCDLLFKGNGQNLPGFMIGRQLTVVASFFLVGSFTSLTIMPGEGNNIFGVSDGAQAFLNYGFQGAVITTILASISWQLAASAYPIAFLNNPVTYILLVVALFLEFIGLCAGAWVLARVQKSVMGFQYDEVYIGTPEDRINNDHPDKEFAPDMGHLAGGGFMGHQVGSHDALDGPVPHSKDALEAKRSRDALETA
jgi:silicon transporter